jgi:hypothetical protein
MSLDVSLDDWFHLSEHTADRIVPTAGALSRNGDIIDDQRAGNPLQVALGQVLAKVGHELGQWVSLWCAFKIINTLKTLFTARGVRRRTGIK